MAIDQPANHPFALVEMLETLPEKNTLKDVFLTLPTKSLELWLMLQVWKGVDDILSKTCYKGFNKLEIMVNYKDKPKMDEIALFFVQELPKLLEKGCLVVKHRNVNLTSGTEVLRLVETTMNHQ